ncbi:E4 [Gould's wattled bat adenovirus 1]|nr:E4 [Mastadenovirus sp.]
MEQIEDPRPSMRMIPLNRCSSHKYHIIGFGFFPNSILTLHREGPFPIPIEWMLPLHLKKLLAYSQLCPNLLLDYSEPFASCPVLSIHCHCKDQRSLQCLAGRTIFVNFISEVLAGAAYNLLFKRYREIVNKGAPDNIKYVGSLYYERCHYIYFRVNSNQELESYMGDLTVCRKEGNIMWGATNWIIYKCRSCDLSGIAARRCAKRARKFFKTILRCNAARLYDRRRRWNEDREQRKCRVLLRWGQCAHDRSILVNN